ncbi:MAG TPA: Uma2 family endonuclease [Acidimicrobiia bacterium]|nr:Uma2 family endonuclease [Acidimicrobiia bacterium]
MSFTETGLTAETYLARDFPPRTQLIDGEVVLVNEPRFRHQRIALYLVGVLDRWSREQGTGEAGFGSDWVVTDRDVLVPDVWWLREERRPGRDAVRAEGAPDLAVEVKSPSTWRFDVGLKRAAYERAGALELWLVELDPDRLVVHRRSMPTAPGFDVHLELGAGDVLTSPWLPGVEISVDELFDR